MLSFKSQLNGARLLPCKTRAQPAPAILSARKAVRCNTASAETLGLLQKTRPIDRLRYQAKLVFDHFDKDADGKLSLEDLNAYFRHSEARLGQVQALREQYTALAASVGGKPLGQQEISFEDFVDLMRAQVATLKANSQWVASQVQGRDLNRLLFKAALTLPEMAVPLATFKLLDQEGGGQLKLEELRKAQGIEKKVFEAVLEDADSNDDGYLSFEDFLTSYHQDRPVFMSMAVMAAHTACFWIIFNLPVDTFLKVVLAGILVLKPQLITGPVIKIWTIGKAIVGRIRATQEMAGKGASWSSLA